MNVQMTKWNKAFEKQPKINILTIENIDFIESYNISIQLATDSIYEFANEVEKIKNKIEIYIDNSWEIGV